MKSKKCLVSLLVVLLVVTLAAFAWIYYNYYTLQQQVGQPVTENENMLSKDEIKDVLDDVSQHIVLPEEVEPMIATIQDAASLANEQLFFSGASDGDILLIYPERALIYSPDKDVLINVGSINVINTELSLDIRNGSENEGVEQSLGEQLHAIDGFNVLNVGPAANLEYPQSILVNLSGKDIAPLEQALGLTAVTELPEGEAPTEAEVVIIIGRGQ